MPTSARKPPGGRRRTRAILALCGIAILALGVRLGVLGHQSLWADEFFSLAMATGHSLEHPASVARPELGDYVEAPGAMPAAHWRAYVEHDHPLASPARVVRAVKLSDTSPPLYYLTLWAWTIVFGTGDNALRVFSIVLALIAFPIFVSLARLACGRRAVLPAAVLYALSPLCVHYSTEGRMYAMVWLFAIGLTWLTLRLWHRGPRPMLLALWVLVGAAGLMTHYYFAFVWAPIALWLLIRPGRLGRATVIAAGLAVAVLIAPWYVHVPASLSAWRVTQEWLTIPPKHKITQNFLRLIWSFVSPGGVWGEARHSSAAAWCVFIALAIVAARPAWRVMLLGTRTRLLWLWMLGACAGPLIMDAWRGTYMAIVPRYAVAGMPAALLLVALALSRLRRPQLRAAFVALIVLIWLPGLYFVWHNGDRMSEKFHYFGKHIDACVQDGDVIIVHSMPSGVIGMARSVGDIKAPIASWVPPLGLRQIPRDLERLTAGHRRVILVVIHAVVEQFPPEEFYWLAEHYRLGLTVEKEKGRIYYFEPRDGKSS